MTHDRLLRLAAAALTERGITALMMLDVSGPLPAGFPAGTHFGDGRRGPLMGFRAADVIAWLAANRPGQ